MIRLILAAALFCASSSGASSSFQARFKDEAGNQVIKLLSKVAEKEVTYDRADGLDSVMFTLETTGPMNAESLKKAILLLLEMRDFSAVETTDSIHLIRKRSTLVDRIIQQSRDERLLPEWTRMQSVIIDRFEFRKEALLPAVGMIQRLSGVTVLVDEDLPIDQRISLTLESTSSNDVLMAIIDAFEEKGYVFAYRDGFLLVTHRQRSRSD